MLDFHSHILYDIDDGPKTIEESRELIAELKRQGVDVVVSTSHFYFNKSVDDFIKKRDERIKNLGDCGIKVLKGAEVYYYDGISHNKELDKLLIEDVGILLLEMPFMHFSERMINDVLSLSINYDICLAHINRYLDYDNMEAFRRFKEVGIYFQVNGEYFRSLFAKKRLKRLLDMNFIDYLGSDCHNIDSRKPDIDKAYELIKSVDEEAYRYIGGLRK